MKEAVTKVIDTLTQEDFHGGLPEVVGTVQVHCSRRRLLGRGEEFHVCTINKTAHTKKRSGNLFNDPRNLSTRQAGYNCISESHSSLTYLTAGRTVLSYDCQLGPQHINCTCPWCSRYRRRKWTRKWTQRYEFKSWTILIAFHIALIPLGKVWIQLFSLQLWVNSRTD